MIYAYTRLRYQVSVYRTIGPLVIKYRNVPKFLDRQVWANSVDPDQTAPSGAV